MSSAAPQRSCGPRASARHQKRFFPKTDASSSSGAAAAAPRDAKPSQPTLTSSLRGPPARPGEKDKRGGARASGGDGFVNYLLQDEAIASGLGADAGGLDAEESQHVVDLLNDQLSRLLKSSPRDFWKEVARNDSLHEFLDSYLQFRHRWYDLPHRGTKGTVAGVIVGEAELCRRVFMVFYRMSSNKEPGAHVNDFLSMKEHTALLQEKKLLDLPKLLDICAIYGHENGDLMRSLVTNAIKAQPTLLENINMVVSHFLSIVHTMHDRCSSSLEVLKSSGGHGYTGHGQLYKDFLEVIDFINDAIATLNAFADAYKPAAMYLSNSFETSYGNEELLSTLARLHDTLLPSLHRGFVVISNSGLGTAENISSGMLSSTVLSLKLLSMRSVKFGWKLLDFCYLSDEPIEDSVLQNSIKMFPAKVEDPAIRGDILVQTLKEINGEVPYNLQGEHASGSFLHNLERNCSILIRIASLRNKGWVYMDEEQFHYLNQIAAPVFSNSWVKESTAPVSSQKDKIQVDEDAVILESKISQIKDLFPDYGKGFLSACLEVYNQNPEEVIQRILEGTLHEDLLALDTSLEQIPPKPVSHSRGDKGKGVLMEPAPNNTLFPPNPVLHSRSDKGKGVLMEPAPNNTLFPPNPVSHSSSDKGKGVLMEPAADNTSLPYKVDLSARGNDADVPSSASVSSHGRFTRKSNDIRSDSEVLDSKTAKNAIRSAVLATEYEYEDEYDDSFDDLGLSVVESGFEEAENLHEKSWESDMENSSRNSTSRWSSQRKPQFYVKDGKNYSYKISGSIAVSSAQEAAIVNQTQREVIHGLGRGGNIPLGAVKKLMDAEEQDLHTSDGVDNSGRGNLSSRGRGGRRGSGNHHRKDRATKKHFQGLGGY